MRTFRLFTKCRAVGLAIVLLSIGARAVPPFIASPSEGEELDDKLTFVFTESMQEQIAVSFSGNGDAEFGCGWVVLVEGQPLQLLECEVESGALPSGATITWTINPGGTGMTTVGGTVIPESSGTVTTPVVTDVTISVAPDNGAVYDPDPDADGPVVFTFNVPMSQSIPAVNAVSFDKGNWSIFWLENRTLLQCILSGDPEPGVYSYTLSGLTSADGVDAPEFTGSFTIEEDPTGGGGDVEIFPSPGDGETLSPTPGLPTQVLFIFSHPMDPSVDLDTAITISQGAWDCNWTQILPGLPVNGLGCSPLGVLVGGTHDYVLSGLKTAEGGTVPDFTGSFIVEGPGTGGEITGGDPAPLCDEDGVPLAFPKSLYVCGPDLFSWNHASLVPVFGDGYLLDSSADVTGGTLASMLLLGEGGLQLGGVTATDIGVRLDGWPAEGLVLATQGGTPVQPDVSFGVFDVTGGTIANRFQHRLAVVANDVSTSLLPGGEVIMVRDANENLETIIFNANGTVKWAKRYSADSFGVDTSLGAASSQNVQISAIENGGFLLVVTKREIVIDINGGSATTTREASAILARLNASGDVQWSKVYTTTGELDSLNVTGPFEDGSILLSGSFSESSVGGAGITTATLARLDDNGTLIWGKKIDGAFVSAMGTTSTGKVLLGGGQGGGLAFDMVFLMMGVTGNIESQVRIDILDLDVGFASIDGNQIVYSILSSDVPSPDPNAPPVDTSTAQTAIVGTSSLALGGFNWKQYARPVSSAFLGVDRDSSEKVFSAFRDNTHRVDVMPLSDNLTTSATCELFTDVSVTVQNASFTAQNATLNSANAGVSAADFTPELLGSEILLTSFTAAEIDICDDGGSGAGDCATPVNLSIVESVGTGMVTVEFTTVLGCTHRLEKSGTVNAEVWIPVETVNGDGSTYAKDFALGLGHEFYRVVSQD